ncbi:MAG: 3-phosphoshikimate 1-carboxyvinyltransferase [Terriglobia bacterium]
MQETVRRIHPTRRLAGTLTLPGDKSISHRYALLGAIAEGTTEISGFASSADCQSTLGCLRALSIPIERHEDRVVIRGKGLHGLSAPADVLDAGNSGSTMRMLAGLLAGQAFKSQLIGDASLSRRPMKRIIDPLVQMGARIQSAAGGLPPLEIEGSELSPIRYEAPVASAQVKTAVLFAGLLANGETEVREAVATRDHTEIALEQMGAPILRKDGRVSIRGPAQLNPLRARVPGDISSAAFFLAAAMMVPGSSILIREVGLNPTRSAMLDLLSSMGGHVRRKDLRSMLGEPVGDVEAQYSGLQGGEISKEMIPGLIDELPVLAVLGTQTERGLTFHGAQELRVKESDRLAAVAENLRRMGAEVEEFPDGLHVPGRQRLRSAEIETYGDHRIAMAFAVAGLAAEGGAILRGSECVAVSFPEFFDKLEQLTEAA